MTNTRKSAMALAVLLAAVETVQAEGILEEVIVTAQRRAQSLQDVPLSVAAISGDRIDVGRVEGIEDIANATPNVVFNSFNMGEPRIYIRGIGNSSDSAASDPAVGVFIDEVYIGRTGGTGAELFDLERVEILRGPQSTLYGKNTNGGAINYITSKPSQEFNAKVSATAGDYDLWSLRGFVTGGLTDDLAGKLTATARQRDGYGKNVITPQEIIFNGDFSSSRLIGGDIGAADSGEELDDMENYSIRGQLLWEPSDNLEILLGFDYSKDETNGRCSHLQNLDQANPAVLEGFWQIAMSEAYKNDERHCASQFDLSQDKEVTGFLARVDYEADFGVITSITAYRESDYDFVDDLTGLPLNDPTGFNTTPENVIDGVDEDADQFSQEFRLNIEGERFSWLAGAFYMEENVDRKEEFYTQYSALITAGLPLANIGDVLFTQDNTTTSYAAFAQVDWHLTEALDITYGIRYSEDEKDITQSSIDLLGNNVPPTGVPLILPGFENAKADETWDETTNRLSVSYNITDDVMVYALYSEGFKSGAFESQTNTAAAAMEPVDPESVENYEIGLKSAWWDGRAQFNASAFFMDYDDLQVFQLNRQLLLRLLNAQAESQGLEASLVLLPMDDLRLSMEYGYLDTEYTDFIDANAEDQSGNDLIRAPENSLTANLDYSLALSGGSALDFRLSYNWTDEYYLSPTNAEKSRQPDVGMIDANITWSSANDEWRLMLWGKNLDDERVINSFIIDPTGITAENYAAPRMWGVTLTKEWL